MYFLLILLTIINKSFALRPKNSPLIYETNGQARVDEVLNKGENIIIRNPDKNFIGLLFHRFPGSFHIKSRRFNSKEITSLELSSVDSMKYYMSFNKSFKEIDIYADDDNEHFSFSLFVSDLCEPDKDGIFVTSIPNQTLIFKANNEDRVFNLSPDTNKCVLIDSGGEISFDVNLEMAIAKSDSFMVFNSHKIGERMYSTTFDNPLFLFFDFKNKEISPEDKIRIKYHSQNRFEHTYQYTSDDELLLNVTKTPITSIMISSAVVSSVFGLFIIFIVFSILHFRKMSGNGGPINNTSNNNEPNMELVQEIPSMSLSDFGKNTPLNEISDNNTGGNEFDLENPPADIYRIAKAKSLNDLSGVDFLRERCWSDMNILRVKSRNNLDKVLKNNDNEEEIEENEGDQSDDASINPYKVDGECCM